MKNNRLRIIIVAIILLRIIADTLLVDISIEQIPRSFNALASFLKPGYWKSLMPYFSLGTFVVHLFNIPLICIGVFGLYRYVKTDKTSKLLLVYLNYKIFFSLVMTLIGLVYFPHNINSLSPLHKMGVFINMLTPILFIILLYPSNYLKVIFRPANKYISKESSLMCYSNIIIDSLIVIVIFLSLGNIFEGLKVNLALGLFSISIIYLFVSLLYFRNSISTIITKSNGNKTTANNI